VSHRTHDTPAPDQPVGATPTSINRQLLPPDEKVRTIVPIPDGLL
jgi:hypothetical protein